MQVRPRVLRPWAAGNHCPVCFAESSEQSKCLLEPCGHAYCLDCILTWSSARNTCPLCSKRFDAVRKSDGSRILISYTENFHPGYYDCIVCHKDTDPGKLLLCDSCDEGYHTYCLNPPMDTVPVGQWFCRSCQGDVRQCGDGESKNGISDGEIAKESKEGGGDAESDLEEVRSVGSARNENLKEWEDEATPVVPLNFSRANSFPLSVVKKVLRNQELADGFRLRCYVKPMGSRGHGLVADQHIRAGGVLAYYPAVRVERKLGLGESSEAYGVATREGFFAPERHWVEITYSEQPEVHFASYQKPCYCPLTAMFAKPPTMDQTANCVLVWNPCIKRSQLTIRYFYLKATREINSGEEILLDRKICVYNVASGTYEIQMSEDEGTDEHRNSRKEMVAEGVGGGEGAPPRVAKKLRGSDKDSKFIGIQCHRSSKCLRPDRHPGFCRIAKGTEDISSSSGSGVRESDSQVPAAMGPLIGKCTSSSSSSVLFSAEKAFSSRLTLERVGRRNNPRKKKRVLKPTFKVISAQKNGDKLRCASACDNCRISKAKCGTRRPCCRCLNYGLQCVRTERPLAKLIGRHKSGSYKKQSDLSTPKGDVESAAKAKAKAKAKPTAPCYRNKRCIRASGHPGWCKLPGTGRCRGKVTSYREPLLEFDHYLKGFVAKKKNGKKKRDSSQHHSTRTSKRSRGGKASGDQPPSGLQPKVSATSSDILTTTLRCKRLRESARRERHSGRCKFQEQGRGGHGGGDKGGVGKGEEGGEAGNFQTKKAATYREKFPESSSSSHKSRNSSLQPRGSILRDNIDEEKIVVGESKRSTDNSMAAAAVSDITEGVSKRIKSSSLPSSDVQTMQPSKPKIRKRVCTGRQYQCQQHHDANDLFRCFRKLSSDERAQFLNLVVSSYKQLKLERQRQLRDERTLRKNKAAMKVAEMIVSQWDDKGSGEDHDDGHGDDGSQSDNSSRSGGREKQRKSDEMKELHIIPKVVTLPPTASSSLLPSSTASSKSQSHDNHLGTETKQQFTTTFPFKTMSEASTPADKQKPKPRRVTRQICFVKPPPRIWSTRGGSFDVILGLQDSKTGRMLGKGHDVPIKVKLMGEDSDSSVPKRHEYLKLTRGELRISSATGRADLRFCLDVPRTNRRFEIFVVPSLPHHLWEIGSTSSGPITILDYPNSASTVACIFCNSHIIRPSKTGKADICIDMCRIMYHIIHSCKGGKLGIESIQALRHKLDNACYRVTDFTKCFAKLSEADQRSHYDDAVIIEEHLKLFQEFLVQKLLPPCTVLQAAFQTFLCRLKTREPPNSHPIPVATWVHQHHKPANELRRHYQQQPRYPPHQPTSQLQIQKKLRQPTSSKNNIHAFKKSRVAGNYCNGSVASGVHIIQEPQQHTVDPRLPVSQPPAPPLTTQSAAVFTSAPDAIDLTLDDDDGAKRKKRKIRIEKYDRKQTAANGKVPLYVIIYKATEVLQAALSSCLARLHLKRVKRRHLTRKTTRKTSTFSSSSSSSWTSPLQPTSNRQKQHRQYTRGTIDDKKEKSEREAVAAASVAVAAVKCAHIDGRMLNFLLSVFKDPVSLDHPDVRCKLVRHLNYYNLKPLLRRKTSLFLRTCRAIDGLPKILRRLIFDAIDCPPIINERNWISSFREAIKTHKIDDDSQPPPPPPGTLAAANSYRARIVAKAITLRQMPIPATTIARRPCPPPPLPAGAGAEHNATATPGALVQLLLPACTALQAAFQTFLCRLKVREPPNSHPVAIWAHHATATPTPGAILLPFATPITQNGNPVDVRYPGPQCRTLPAFFDSTHQCKFSKKNRKRKQIKVKRTRKQKLNKQSAKIQKHLRNRERIPITVAIAVKPHSHPEHRPKLPRPKKKKVSDSAAEPASTTRIHLPGTANGASSSCIDTLESLTIASSSSLSLAAAIDAPPPVAAPSHSSRGGCTKDLAGTQLSTLLPYRASTEKEDKAATSQQMEKKKNLKLACAGDTPRDHAAGVGVGVDAGTEKEDDAKLIVPKRALPCKTKAVESISITSAAMIETATTADIEEKPTTHRGSACESDSRYGIQSKKHPRCVAELKEARQIKKPTHHLDPDSHQKNETLASSGSTSLSASPSYSSKKGTKKSSHRRGRPAVSSLSTLFMPKRITSGTLRKLQRGNAPARLRQPAQTVPSSYEHSADSSEALSTSSKPLTFESTHLARNSIHIRTPSIPLIPSNRGINSSSSTSSKPP